MYCLKCGRETDGNQIFCDGCLESMTHYPVKHDIVVQLPARSTSPVLKQTSPRKRPVSLEERFAKTIRRNRWLTGAVILLSLALILATLSLVHQASQLQPGQLIGRNYTINTTAD